MDEPHFVVLLVLWLAVAVIFGLITYWIAMTRNRTSVGYFLLGFFYGPLGPLVATLLHRGNPPTPSGMLAVDCLRCNAGQNVEPSEPEWTCWQCDTTFPTVA